MKKLILFTLILLALGAIAAYFMVPWNAMMESRITTFLNQRGLQDISLKIDHVGMREATFSTITVGKENPLLLQSVTVQYNPKELIDGNLQDIVLSGLDVQVLETDEGWKIAGMDGLKSSGDKRTMTLSDAIDMLPFTSVDIKDSHLRIAGKSIQTALPFNLHLDKGPQTTLEMTINGTTLSAASSNVSLGIIKIKAQPDEARNWKGDWTLESLDPGESLPFPVLSGKGALSNTGDIVVVDGALTSADKAYSGTFSMSLNLADPTKNTLMIGNAIFPFKEGVISAKNTAIPFSRTKNITVNVNVRRVSLNALMQSLTKERVTATGTVSGGVPVILRPDGSYAFGKGTLKADGEGLIQMSEGALPVDNEQTQLVSQILENLHYSVFNAAVDTAGEGGMVLRLSLEGRNPDVYNGRVVKLNVNLTGDVLDFIRQNAMLITSPEQLLKQGTQ